MAAVVLIGFGAFLAVQALTPSQPFPCISTEGGIAYHWHVDLSISSGSTVVTIPEGIGISTFCTQPLHTHSADGRIHVESDILSQRYTIGDFFRVWNKPWGSPTIMHVDDAPMTPNQGQILTNDLRIHLQYDSFS